jgi:hypothetical protein
MADSHAKVCHAALTVPSHCTHSPHCLPPKRTFWVKLKSFEDEDGVTTGRPRLAKEFVDSIAAKEFTEPAPLAWTCLDDLRAAAEADPAWAADVAAVGGRLAWPAAKILFTDGEMRTPSKEERDPSEDLPKSPSSTRVFISVRFVPITTSDAARGVCVCVSV